VSNSGELLEHLLHPHPQDVRVERQGGTARISFSELEVGDTIVVDVGELIPVDGRVEAGIAQVNQASVTGESAPVTIKATMSEGARRGVLIKGGPSIEKLAHADTFVFDKTG
jgi:P-type E1-E2 ATPase